MSQGTASQRLRPFRPQAFGRYILLMPLSTGGMGEIFLAQLQGSHGFDKMCVIKKILPHLAQDQDFVSRFIDEAHILVKLSHGSIAQVLDMGVHDGSPYIALEFVDGKDLRRVLMRMRERNLPLPLSFVLSVMIRVLDALAYAHRKRGDDDRDLNLVHRDVSPQNVLISYEGEVKIIDFGLAKSAMSLSKTNPSIVLGKFMYMSPEQARHKPVDRRSDLYAVGLCLWELVAGKNAFEEVPSGELMGKVANPGIPALNTVEPLCPAALSDAVAKVLSVDPTLRFQTAEELRAKLQSILLDIDPESGPESTSRFMRDAFASEYAAERRMLGTVKEQARALQPDDEALSASATNPEEETAQGMASPFSKQTPVSVPAITMDDETPAASRLHALNPEALSFAPTPKAGGSPSSGKKNHEVHEKETMPAIVLKPDSVEPPMPTAPNPVRARVLAKSFDQESTELGTPAIAEPVPMPSIMIDGLPSHQARTELEVPAQQPPASPPRKKPSQPPKSGTTERRAVGRPSQKVSTPAKRQQPIDTPPPAPQRTDTMVIRNPLTDLPPVHVAPAPKKGGSMWAWFVIPGIAIAALVGYIAWDLYSEQLSRDAVADVEEESPQIDVPADPPKAQPKIAADEPPPEAKVVDGAALVEPEPKKTTSPAVKVSPAAAKRAAGGSPGELAFRAMKADYEKIIDEGVQRKFRLQVTAFEGQVLGKGEDPVFVGRVEDLHEQVKAALAKQ